MGVESQSYGVGTRLSFFTLGFFFQGSESEKGLKDEGTGLGLKGGELGYYRNQQLVVGILGGEDFYSLPAQIDDKGLELKDKKGIGISLVERANLKSYRVRTITFYNYPVAERKIQKKEAVRKEILSRVPMTEETKAMLPEDNNTKPFGYPKEYLYQVEGFLGVYGGVRVGVNFAEALDFVLGLTTYDLLSDDAKKEKDAEVLPGPAKESEAPKELEFPKD